MQLGVYQEHYRLFYSTHLMPAVKAAGIQVDKNFQDTTPTNFNNHEDYHDKDCEDPNIFEKMAFHTEGKFMSEPTFAEYKKVTEADDWGRVGILNLRNTFVDSDRSSITSLVKQHYKIPKDKVGKEQYFSYYTWIS